jgi:nodulation protein Z
MCRRAASPSGRERAVTSDRFLLVKGRAGLGNRILGVVSGLQYARLSGRRLVVDWRDDLYSDDGSNVFPRYFRCAEAHSLDELPDTASVTPPLWVGRLDESASARERTSQLGPIEFRRMSSVDLTRLDHPEQVAVMWVTLSHVLFLTAHHRHAFEALGRRPAYELLRGSLRSELRPAGAIERRVDGFARASFERPMVGVHVRFSDRRGDLDVIRRRLEAVTRREPAARIFLATDNAAVKAEFEQAYSGVLTAPKWYPPPGTPAHLHGDNPSRFRTGAEALVDLYLLARCDYLVVDTASSFARVACLLSHAPGSRITDVNRRAHFRRRVSDMLAGLSPRLAHEAGRAYERLIVRTR